MAKKIISAAPDDTLKKAMQQMKHYEISQMPVIAKGIVAGIISEGVLLDALTSGKSPGASVLEVMGDAPPIISLLAGIDAASHLLKYYPLVMVQDKGNLAGVVTKADIIRAMFKG